MPWQFLKASGRVLGLAAPPDYVIGVKKLFPKEEREERYVDD